MVRKTRKKKPETPEVLAKKTGQPVILWDGRGIDFRAVNRADRFKESRRCLDVAYPPIKRENTGLPPMENAVMLMTEGAIYDRCEISQNSKCLSVRYPKFEKGHWGYVTDQVPNEDILKIVELN